MAPIISLTLPIYLLGKTNAVKMIFLRQLLYLPQNIPVCIFKTFFKRLDSINLSFVWDYKIGKAHLCKPKTSGGLALPNFIHYYWATNIRSIYNPTVLSLGICCVGDLYLEGVFASFQQLQEKYAFSQCDFFKNLQVRSYVRTHLPDFEGAVADRLDSCLKYSNWSKNNSNFLPVQQTLEYSSNYN